MRHHTALKRSDTGKWHYVSAHRSRGAYPIGYCADGCPGHDTEQEARDHARDYVLDRVAFTDDSSDARSQHRCEAEGCDEFTSGSARLPWGGYYTLCAAHRNRATVEVLFGEIGDSWTTMGP